MPKAHQLPPNLITKGICKACGGEYTRAGMTKHLSTCPARQAQQGLMTARTKPDEGQLLHLFVEGSDDPLYWLHLEIPANATLLDLDNYLTEHWLECCGHLSAFEINQVRYAVFPDEEYGLEEKSMRGAKLAKLLNVGQSFHYEYDYGSTTDLDLKVVAERTGLYPVRSKAPKLLAENLAPLIPCDNCGKTPAVQVCTECRWQGKAWWCEQCARKHSEHQDYFCRWLIPRV